MASGHTVRKVKAWMKGNKVDLLPWPTRSPDLNPIESIWAWMDKELIKEPKFATIFSNQKRCVACKKARILNTSLDVYSFCANFDLSHVLLLIIFVIMKKLDILIL